MIHRLTIDPSMRSLGYALASIDQSNIQYLSYGSLVALGDEKDTPWRLRSYEMADALYRDVGALLSVHRIKSLSVITEVPDNWFTEKGMDSKNNEAVQKLYFFTGCMIGVLKGLSECTAVYATVPSQWKGQAPKRVMIQRCIGVLQRRVGDHITPGQVRAMPDDTVEAIMLMEKSLRALDKFEQVYDASSSGLSRIEISDYII